MSGVDRTVSALKSAIEGVSTGQCYVVTGGYISGGTQQVDFMVPLMTTSKAKITAMELMIRQGGKYVLGTADTFYKVNVSTQVAHIWQWPGAVSIELYTIPTTGATNNDACGISARVYFTKA